MTAEAGREGRLWALYLPDRILFDRHAIEDAARYRPDVEFESSGDDVVRAAMNFHNGLAVYVFDGAAHHDEVPIYLRHAGLHMLQPPEWTWMRLERWEPAL